MRHVFSFVSKGVRTRGKGDMWRDQQKNGTTFLWFIYTPTFVVS